MKHNSIQLDVVLVMYEYKNIDTVGILESEM
jgi:hypothetical protein